MSQTVWRLWDTPRPIFPRSCKAPCRSIESRTFRRGLPDLTNLQPSSKAPWSRGDAMTVIRQLTADDLESAFTLSATAGWNQRLEDWRMLLTLAPAGCFAAVAHGRIVGTSIGINYRTFGWIA